MSVMCTNDCSLTSLSKKYTNGDYFLNFQILILTDCVMSQYFICGITWHGLNCFVRKVFGGKTALNYDTHYFCIKAN